jgi:hypothetical protein
VGKKEEVGDTEGTVRCTGNLKLEIGKFSGYSSFCNLKLTIFNFQSHVPVVEKIQGKRKGVCKKDNN